MDKMLGGVFKVTGLKHDFAGAVLSYVLDGRWFSWLAESLTLVNPERLEPKQKTVEKIETFKFKVGDTVRVCATKPLGSYPVGWDDQMDKMLNGVFEITKVILGSPYCTCHYELAGPWIGSFQLKRLFIAESLTLVTKSIVPGQSVSDIKKPKFKIGDMVRVCATRPPEPTVPVWLPIPMDEMLGKCYPVKFVGLYFCTLEGNNLSLWNFHSDWLTLVEEEVEKPKTFNKGDRVKVCATIPEHGYWVRSMDEFINRVDTIKEIIHAPSQGNRKVYGFRNAYYFLPEWLTLVEGENKVVENRKPKIGDTVLVCATRPIAPSGLWIPDMDRTFGKKYKVIADQWEGKSWPGIVKLDNDFWYDPIWLTIVEA
jgi:ribosomal protein S17